MSCGNKTSQLPVGEKSPKSPSGEETPRVDPEVKGRLSLLPPGGISGKWAHPSG